MVALNLDQDDPIVLPPLFEPGVAVKKSLINFVSVLGAQAAIGLIAFGLADPVFQTTLAHYLPNQMTSALAIAALTAVSTGLRNWLKHRNTNKELE